MPMTSSSKEAVTGALGKTGPRCQNGSKKSETGAGNQEVLLVMLDPGALQQVLLDWTTTLPNTVVRRKSVEGKQSMFESWS